MNQFYIGFEKKAAMTPSQRRAAENEMHASNVESTSFKKMAPLHMRNFGGLGAATGGLIGLTERGAKGGLKGALIGGALGAATGAATGAGVSSFWKNRGTGYLKNIKDQNLERGLRGVRALKAGDKKGPNKAYWRQQIANAKENKQVFRDLLAKEK